MTRKQLSAVIRVYWVKMSVGWLTCLFVKKLEPMHFFCKNIIVLWLINVQSNTPEFPVQYLWWLVVENNNYVNSV